MGEIKMNTIDTKMYEIIKEKGYTELKGYLTDVYDYNRMSDKKVYQKILKFFISNASREKIIHYHNEILVTRIDNVWRDTKNVDFVELSKEIIELIKKQGL